MRVRYLSFAIADLAEIRAYLGTNYPSLVTEARQKLRDSLNGLARFPNLGRSGRVFGTRELVIPKVGKLTYVAVYRVVGDEVQILRVLVGRRDIDGILAEGLGMRISINPYFFKPAFL
ncbi:MAG: type II toxin-antitoxin system RelE/ParE family toxin [Coleofasciculaceae cyanobacterium RL_1_1]|nr:type II toxin-antitoxin system RelE/ParE family toxin [Coleofasciculaceae cyanobacterium RL_1_1]